MGLRIGIQQWASLGLQKVPNQLVLVKPPQGANSAVRASSWIRYSQIGPNRQSWKATVNKQIHTSTHSEC